MTEGGMPKLTHETFQCFLVSLDSKTNGKFLKAVVFGFFQNHFLHLVHDGIRFCHSEKTKHMAVVRICVYLFKAGVCCWIVFVQDLSHRAGQQVWRRS